MEETLEEVSEKIYPPRITWVKSFAKVESEAFKKGVKWQQERSYSEKDLKNIINNLIKDCYFMQEPNQSVAKWFEQFKKK